MTDQFAKTQKYVALEDAKVGERYWLTLMDRVPAGPSYFGKILKVRDQSVEVEIEVMAAHDSKATAYSVENWPREQVEIREAS